MTAPSQRDGHSLWLFFLTTNLWSWLIWIPAVAAYHASGSSALTWWLLLAGVLGAWGPSVAALALTWFKEGTSGLRRLLRGFFSWRVGWTWYAVAVLLPAALLGVGILTQSLFLNSPSEFQPAGWLPRLIAAALFVLPFGPLGEELGWRGYALPRLQARYSALTSSLILGVFWTIWHVPLFWIPGAALSPDAPIDFSAVAAYAASVLGTSILFTWLFNNTASSLLLAVLFHLALNVTGQVVMPMFPDWSGAERLRVDFLSFVATKWCVVLVVIVVFGPAQLSRLGLVRAPCDHSGT